MLKFDIGDSVRIKDKPDWPSPPSFRFAGAEGTIVASDFDELMGEFFPYMVCVKIEKAGKGTEEYVVDSGFWFLADEVEKK